MVQHLFLSRLACYILNLPDKHSITFVPADIPIHLNGGSWLSATWKVDSRVASSSSHSWGSMPILGSNGCGSVVSSCTNQYQHYYTLDNALSLGALGLGMLISILGHLCELCHFSSCISYPSSVQVSGRLCHGSFQTSYSSGILLDGGSLVPTVISMLEDIPC